ncbi:MAG: amidase [Gammaproteobacteria bacterium]|nr:amidase [Gammaproteobacteria bacterium]
MQELTRLSASECVALLKSKDIRPRDLVTASMDRTDAVDGAINALPIRCPERAMAQAESVDPNTVLAGLPVAVKDYNHVSGVKTTYGSPLFADFIATSSDATVLQLEKNGAIPIAKSNVPEWAGGHTFNPVFGTTRNPWNTARTAGGSSGGSAAALATGQVWLATGNDLGGSLRTPAGFNAVVGLRPGPGRVPRGLRLQPFDSLWVEGPMARNVRDVALMLDAGAGHSAEDPLSFETPPGLFSDTVTQDIKPKRIAFSTDLGQVPMAKEVATVCQTAALKCTQLGAELTDDIPDFSGVIDSFQTLRAVLVATMMGTMLEQHRANIAPEIVGNIERGFEVTPEQLFSAERVRWKLYESLNEFFKHHDLLMCPSASIEPFPVEQRYVEEIDGTPLTTYIDWFSITFALSMCACPVISIPCGFTANGLPVGMQIMGKPRGEASLLSMARQIESLFGVAEQLPIEP